MAKTGTWRHTFLGENVIYMFKAAGGSKMSFSYWLMEELVWY